MHQHPGQPPVIRYGTVIDTISGPDGSTTSISKETALIVDASDENTAARLAATTYIENTYRLPPVGSTIHVHVLRHPQRTPRMSARQWTIDVYVDTAAQTLH